MSTRARQEAPRTEGWREPAAGELVLFVNPSIEGAESAWAELEERADAIQWRKGAVVHAVHHHGVYGHDSISGFARAVRESYSTLRDYAATYARLLRLEAVAQATVLAPATLRYSHYRACNAIRSDADYQRILLKAAAGGWSTGKTAEAAQVVITREREADQPRLEEEPQDNPPELEESGTPVDLDEFRSRRELERENERLRQEVASQDTLRQEPSEHEEHFFERGYVSDYDPPDSLRDDEPEAVPCPLCGEGHVAPELAARARHALTSRPSGPEHG